MNDFDANAKYEIYRNKPVYKVFARKSKKIIDQIDEVLAFHYGLTKREKNFILNYDLKYRMGTDFDETELSGRITPTRKPATTHSLSIAAAAPSSSTFVQQPAASPASWNNPAYDQINTPYAPISPPLTKRITPLSDTLFNPYNQNPSQHANNPLHWQNSPYGQMSTPPAPIPAPNAGVDHPSHYPAFIPYNPNKQASRQQANNPIHRQNPAYDQINTSPAPIPGSGTSSSTTASQPGGPSVPRPQIAPLQTYTGLQRNYQTVLAELHTQETRFYHTIANFERGSTEESSVNEEREMFRTRQARALAAWQHMADFAQRHPHAGIHLPNPPSILTRKI